MATCANGHENPQGQDFCGECGIATKATVAICPHGHTSSKRQKFCGNCGAPVSAPVRGATRGRWAVDPFARHQYRFWDGSGWSGHVADNGALSTDAPPSTGASTAERWIGVAAGVVTVVLLAGAVSAIVTQFSPKSDPPLTAAPAPTVPLPAPPPAPSTPPQDASAPWPVAVIGATCRPYSSNAVTADGSVAYCVNLADTEAFMWSLFPNDLRVPAQTNPGQEASVAVCMAQTTRSRPDCVEYLARPSDPGDGQPSSQ